MAVRTIDLEKLEANVFSLLANDWFIVSAEKDGKLNGMTASWGGLGILWGKQVAFVFIRPARYTKEFVDASDYMTLSFFEEKYRQVLQYFGAVSGRKEDKIAKQGLTVVHEGLRHRFEESRLTLLGRKLYAQPMEPTFFNENVDDINKIREDLASKGGYHTMYVVELEQALIKGELWR